MSEADRIKLLRESDASCRIAEGGRPIRKRGYHRALKRGESWAVIKRAFLLVSFEFVKRLLYGSSMFDKINEKPLCGYTRIKVEYGKKPNEP